MVLAHKYEMPVWSMLMLLRPAADGPELTGVFERSFRGGGTNRVFRYDVVRIWLEAPEKLLTAGVTLPGMLEALSSRR
jgi:hypothetical protein